VKFDPQQSPGPRTDEPPFRPYANPFATPPVAKPTSSGKGRGPLGALGAFLLLVLSKAKTLLVLLKALPFAKVLLSGGSFMVYVAYMAMRSGWRFGVGFVILLLIHELGHAFAIKRAGLRSGWPVFIPMFGAMISLKDAPQSREVDAKISFGGPLWGTIASLACILLYPVTHDEIFLGLGSTGMFLNGFNMTPIRPLDGGAIAEMFSRRAWLIGLVFIGILALTTGFSMALIFVLMGLPKVFERSKEELEPVDPGVRTIWAVKYLGLLGVMAGGFFLAQFLRGTY
jgi:Zn-dependent protease